MKSPYFVNLKPYFNFRAVYSNDTTNDGEVPRFSQKYFKFGMIAGDGVAARFGHNSEYKDSIVCARQSIMIESIPCDDVVVLGTCCWGAYAEKFQLVFSDGTEDVAEARYLDWCWPLPSYELEFTQQRAWLLSYGRVFTKYPKFNGAPGEDYIFYTKTELSIKRRNLKQIILPNIFMNIFAITLYAGEE